MSRSKGGRAGDREPRLAEPRGLQSVQDRDTLFGLAEGEIAPLQVVQALIRRLVAIQDHVSEAEQLALVGQIRNLLSRGHGSH